jgi:hypothetical protein
MLLILCYIPRRGVPITWARGVDGMGEDKRGQQDRAGFRVPTIGQPVPPRHPGCGDGGPVRCVPCRAFPRAGAIGLPPRSVAADPDGNPAGPAPPYLPSSLEIVRMPGGAVLRIGYPVPSPLGLLGSGG